VGLTAPERSGVMRALSLVLSLGNLRFADAPAGFEAAAHALGCGVSRAACPAQCARGSARGARGQGGPDAMQLRGASVWQAER
jgi:hypothetical protein